MNNNIVNVNMVPNSFDIGVLECSQGDTEARKFKLRLMHGKDPIDISDVQEPLLPQFPSYKGGTEEILPTNGSVPSTAPIIADIQYPQGLLNDQEFLYRESPSEEDGIAKFTYIKGNTLNWNQISIVPSTETRDGVAFTRNDEKTTLQMSGTSTSTIFKQFSEMPMTTVGHVYYVDKGADSTLFHLYNDSSGINTDTGRRAIGTATAQKRWYFRIPNGTTIDVTAKPMIIDLTQMFGAGNEPSTVEEFTSLFPLPFYDFNQGTLIPFSGNGIKTTGFNQWDEEWEVGGIYNSSGSNNAQTNKIRSKNYIPCLPNTQYCLWNGENVNTFMYFYDGNKNFISMGSTNTANPRIDTTPSNCAYIRFRTDDLTEVVYKNNICLNISDTSKNGTYEPYTSTTTDLPISTYFPTGMKSAGSVYDELTESKAITRVGSVDLGTLDWTSYSLASNSFSALLTGGKATGTNYSAKGNCSIYALADYITAFRDGDKVFGIGYANLSTRDCYVAVRDTSYTDATAFKTAMNGVYLYYELATETETDITIASLLAENGEIPLTVEDDYLVGVCNQDISKKAGTYDGKVKLVNGGTVYSNKVQIHVERRPE